ncbi:MAG: AAA family ATPase, partial [Anaerolineae bacterium]|nr:AAA family ATPase [Anaerolineae bacterium]
MNTFVLAFSGSIGSGKTTITEAVAKSLGWKLASFGRVVRKEARQRGLDPESRETLQLLGSELIEEGWEGFCQAVLVDAGWKQGEGLLVDGIRHIEALEMLRILVQPLRLFLIHVHVKACMREKRLFNRNGYTKQDIYEMDRHKCIIRAMPTTDSDGCRPPVPSDAV